MTEVAAIALRRYLVVESWAVGSSTIKIPVSLHAPIIAFFVGEIRQWK